jgi:hypothetical protein
MEPLIKSKRAHTINTGRASSRDIAKGQSWGRFSSTSWRRRKQSKNCSLTGLEEKLNKFGAKLVSRGRRSDARV